jgi:hypothetical protein
MLVAMDLTTDPTRNALSQVGIERHQPSRWQRIASPLAIA